MRRISRYEIGAMVLAVVMAAVSVFATFASARSGDLVFCRLVDGVIVVGLTTDCSAARSVDAVEIVEVRSPAASSDQLWSARTNVS